MSCVSNRCGLDLDIPAQYSEGKGVENQIKCLTYSNKSLLNGEQTAQDEVLMTHRCIESQALWEIKHVCVLEKSNNGCIGVLQTRSFDLHASDRLYIKRIALWSEWVYDKV